MREGREGDRVPPKSYDWVNHGTGPTRTSAAIKGALLPSVRLRPHSKSLMHAHDYDDGDDKEGAYL